MKNTLKSIVAIAAGGILAAGALAGCSTTPGDTGGATDGATAGAVSVGLLLPESKTTRYESFDRPLFTAALQELGDYEVEYQNADQDAAKQQQQAEAMIASGVKVLVLDPVDAEAAAGIVAAAGDAGIPVVSYDRLIDSPDIAFYVSFDNNKVGVLQGEALVEGLDAEGTSGGIIMINGSPTDPNAAGFKSGAHSAIDASDYPILAEYDTPDWSPDKAQAWMDQQITAFAGQFVGVYAANDGTAGGAITAMRNANVTPWPLVTGQDSELAGIQRVVEGTQFMTVYKSINQETKAAAKAVDEIVKNGSATGASADTNGVPTTLLDPVAVTIDNIKDTVVADGFWTIEQICTPDYADACAAAGLN